MTLQVFLLSVILVMNGCESFEFFFLNQVWDPELYELHGGSPFSTKSDGNLTDSSGTHLYLMGDVRKIMNELKNDR